MLSILIVDDKRSVRASLLRMLAAAGHKVREASSGAEALQSAARERPDVILMDIVMPGQNGFEAAREIRKHAHLATVPIIALTASPMVLSEIQPLFQGVLTKPCQAAQLLAAIESAHSSTS